MSSRFLLVLLAPVVATLATLALDSSAAAQAVEPSGTDAIPSWMWRASAVGLATAASLAFATLAWLARQAVDFARQWGVSQLRRLDEIEKQLADVQAKQAEAAAETKSLGKLADGIGTLHRRIDGLERRWLDDGK